MDLSEELRRRLGVEQPVFQAPIGAIAAPEFAAAVSENGAAGTWPAPGVSPVI